MLTFDFLYNLNVDVKNRDSLLELLQKQLEEKTIDKKRAHRIQFVLNFFLKTWVEMGGKLRASISAQFNAVFSMFVSDPDLNTSFCPHPESENLFQGFDFETLEKKIIVLNMSAKDISGRVIGILLKLDFQRTALNRTRGKSENSITKPCFLLIDEAHNFVSGSNDSGDTNFLPESRKNKIIPIYMSQSYDSYLDALKDEKSFRVFSNLLRTKIIFSQEGHESQKICADSCGKEETFKLKSLTDTEAGRDTEYNLGLGEFVHEKMSITKGATKSLEYEYYFQPSDFRDLPVFVAIVSPFDGTIKMKPRIVYTKPMFINSNGEIEKYNTDSWFNWEGNQNFENYLDCIKEDLIK